MNFGETQTFGPIQYRLWKVGTIRPTLFILHCRVWQRNQWGWFAIKVDDDRNLADGDVEMKEWFRIRFGGRTDENCQWGKERMTARFLTWTVSWRVVPFSETWKLRLKWEVGKGVGWVFAYILSLDCLFLSLHPVTPFPIFGSQLKCHFSNVVLFPNSSKQTSYIQYMLAWCPVLFLSSCVTLQKWPLHIVSITPTNSLPIRTLGHETILDHPTTSRPTSWPERYERAQLSTQK